MIPSRKIESSRSRKIISREIDSRLIEGIGIVISKLGS